MTDDALSQPCPVCDAPPFECCECNLEALEAAQRRIDELEAALVEACDLVNASWDRNPNGASPFERLATLRALVKP